MARYHFFSLSLITVFAAGCVQVKTEPIDINLNISGELRLKIDKQLDNFFDDIDDASATVIAD